MDIGALLGMLLSGQGQNRFSGSPRRGAFSGGRVGGWDGGGMMGGGGMDLSRMLGSLLGGGAPPGMGEAMPFAPAMDNRFALPGAPGRQNMPEQQMSMLTQLLNGTLQMPQGGPGAAGYGARADLGGGDVRTDTPAYNAFDYRNRMGGAGDVRTSTPGFVDAGDWWQGNRGMGR